jgi:tetratricopeptide (TPR) repeat protein
MSGNAVPAEAPLAPSEAPLTPAEAPVAAPVPISTPDPAIPENARQAFLAAAQRHQSGDNDGAMKLYIRALDLHPQFADAYNNIGVILRAQEKLPAAAASFRRALSIRADNSAVLSNLGNVLWQMLRFEEAATAFKRALELDPQRPETLHNLGLLLHSMGDYPEAIECFDKSLAVKDGNVDVLWDRSLTRLVMGDFDRGWLEYEIRWRLKHNPPRRFAFPLWEGQESRALSLLVHHEQGLGDTLHFCRYLPMVAPKVGRLVFECQAELARLMTCLPGIAEVIPSGRPSPACDYHVPLLNLPRFFRTNLDNIPATIPYLQAPVGTSAPTVHRPPGTKLAVGIVWAGKPSHNNDKNRSTSLDRFLCLADLPGVSLYSLQKGLRTADIQTLGAQALITDLGSKVTDFAETAALLPQLDLIVAVDTAVVHLAGALGIPTFVLMPFTPDWRWLRGRDDTPWYPSLRLFRQPKPREWDSVFDRIRSAVQAML